MADSARMKELVRLATAMAPASGVLRTALDALRVVRQDRPTDRLPDAYAPSLCFVLQGEKETTLAGSTFRFRPGQCLVVPVTVPVMAQVVRATPQAPFLCLVLELDPDLIFGLLKDLGPLAGQARSKPTGPRLERADEALLEPLARLLGCLGREGDRLILAPLILRELTYRLLQSPLGGTVRGLGVAASHARRITQAIERLRARFHLPVRMEELAREVHLSPSAFYAAFRQVTGLSPLQYQKALRLHEARRLLASDGGDAASVAYRVGYESPSQFSREYARLFGLPPGGDLRRMRGETSRKGSGGS